MGTLPSGESYTIVHNKNGSDPNLPKGDGVLVEWPNVAGNSGKIFVPTKNGKWDRDYSNLQTQDSEGHWHTSDVIYSAGTDKKLNAAVHAAAAEADPATSRDLGEAPLPSRRPDSRNANLLRSHTGPKAAALHQENGHRHHPHRHKHARLGAAV